MSRLYAVAAIAVALGFVSIAATEQVFASSSPTTVSKSER
jgi:hypothetical protein